MATVRELIAELGFKVDDKQAKSFKKTIDGIQTAFNTFAVGAFLKQAGSVDNAFERTRRNIELLAGDKGLGLLEDAMGKRVISSSKEMAEAVRNSLETLTDPKFTKATIGLSEKLAVALGKSADEIQQTFDAAASTQSLDPLRKLGLATQQQVEAFQRLNVNYTTATAKQMILNKIVGKSALIQKLYNQALERSDTQTNIMLKNFSDIGKMIGKFINPIMAKLLIIFNKILEFFINNKIGQFILKVGALAGIFTVIVGSVVSLIAAIKVLSILLSPLFIKIALITAAIVLIGLAIEDLWLTFSDPAADTFFRSLLDPLIKAQGMVDTLIETFKLLFKATPLGLLVGGIGKLSDMTGIGMEEIFPKPVGRPGAISGLQNDNRKLEINVTAGAGANGQEIATAIKENIASDFYTAQFNMIPDAVQGGGK